MTFKQMLQQQVKGWAGKLAVHHVGYLSDGHVHRGVPYNNVDPKVIKQKLELMQSIGVDTVITTWQGPWAVNCHEDAMLTCEFCEEFGMTFALLLDPGGMQKWQSGLTQTQITANVQAALSDPGAQAMVNSDAYVSEKYVLDFNTGASLVQLEADFPLNFIEQNVGFSWPMIPWNQSGYAAMNALATMKIPGICAYFNDAGQPLPVGVSTQAAWVAAGSQRDYSKSVWGGPARVLDHQGGQFLFNQLGTIQASAPYIAVVTWDDYDEQSSGPLEAVVAAAAGVNWFAL